MRHAKALLCNFINAYELWIKYDIVKLDTSKGHCVIMWWHNKPANTKERTKDEIIADLRAEIEKNGFFLYFCKSDDKIEYVFKVKEIIVRKEDLPSDHLPADWKDCNDYHEDLSSYSMTKAEARIFFKTFEIIKISIKLDITDFDFGASRFRPRNLNAIYDYSARLGSYVSTLY